MQEKTLKKDSYFIKKALQTPFTQKIQEKFKSPQKTKKPSQN